MPATIILPDGYNGHAVECDAQPIAEDGSMVKLRVTGSSHLIRWERREKWEALTAKPNELATPDGIILIQSCDNQTANVGIVINKLTCYRRVSLPGLTQCEDSRFYPWEMTDQEFARVLTKHAGAVLALIATLTQGEPNR